jgi:flagellar biosynthesis protein FliQ
MAPELLMRLLSEALYLAVLVAAPVVLATLVVSVVVGVVQAATGVQDQAISFAPRAGAVIVAFLLAGPWIGAQVLRFARVLLEAVAGV